LRERSRENAVFSFFLVCLFQGAATFTHISSDEIYSPSSAKSLAGGRRRVEWNFSWRHCCSLYAVSISTVRHIHQCALDVYLHVCVDGPSAVRLARLASSQNISSKTRRGRKNQKRTVDGGIKPVTRASNKFFFFGLYFLSSGLCVCVCVLFLWM
jgi:hypothetical protein